MNMKNTLKTIFADTRYNMACTYIVNCMGITEIYTRETKDKMFRMWGEETATVRFLNTKELVINID